MKKTKIVNGRREWANKDYVEEIQTCYANPNLGKGYFVDVWVHELLVGELGFLFMSGGEFFILASNEGDLGLRLRSDGKMVIWSSLTATLSKSLNL